jgi:hypothetical protein
MMMVMVEHGSNDCGITGTGTSLRMTTGFSITTGGMVTVFSITTGGMKGAGVDTSAVGQTVAKVNPIACAIVQKNDIPHSSPV